ncbi:hypothetical protein RRG08_006062 [Elysia crispata]|uniref:Uncharacterized protein n=1 Tax=Elysia crispata TaxID=231223 RepID=A0AAE0Z3W5_9GAST|nr:hypothetical protein RRG08_006062 [Elysia crispata]
MAVISLWRKKTAGTGKGRGGSKVHVCHEGDRVKKDNCLGTRDQEGEELWEVDNYDECTTPGRCCWPLHSVTRSRLGVARRVWGTWRRDAAFPAFIKDQNTGLPNIQLVIELVQKDWVFLRSSIDYCNISTEQKFEVHQKFVSI